MRGISEKEWIAEECRGRIVMAICAIHLAATAVYWWVTM